MNHFETRAYQRSFREFARIEHWLAPHAVTLTLRQGLAVSNGAADTFVLLTRQLASQNYRHFLNLLGSMALGQAAKRFGRRINSISTIEGGKGKRLHIHAVIDCPRDDLLETFPSMITEAWRTTQWGYGQIDIQRDADSGWIKYISKLRDKPDYAAAIDWENFHNADCRV